MAPEDLLLFATKFDIGLALEPGFCMNNDLAVSNKLFTYLQAGLCVIASDTTGQANFIRHYPAAGTIYPKGDSSELAKLLLTYYHDQERLNTAKKKAWQLADEQLNWDNTQYEFLKNLERTLHS